MICPKCKEEGLTSRVFPGTGTTTLVYYQPFYDEQGRYHHHDSNMNTMEYKCSNGHQWTEQTSGTCWCGWPNNKKEKVK